jgi:hypothetical protein
VIERDIVADFGGLADHHTGNVIRVLAALDLDLSVVPRRTTEFGPTEH